MEDETPKQLMDGGAKKNLFEKFISQIAMEHAVVCFEDCADLVLSLVQLDAEKFALNARHVDEHLDFFNLSNCFQNKVVLQPIFGINHHGDWILNTLNNLEKDAISIWVLQEKIIDQNLLDTFVINQNAIPKGSIVAIELL